MKAIYISVLGMAAISIANAGVIEIGSAVTGNSGLTSAYVSGTTTSCSGFTAQGNACIVPGAPNPSTTVQRNFDTALFAGATPAATPYAGYSATTQGQQTPGGMMQANGSAPFVMMSDSVNPVFGTTKTPNSNDFWEVATNGAILDIPVGILGVTDVWTELSNIYGTPGSNDTTVFLDFGTSSNVVNAADIIQVNLTNSGAKGASPSGQIEDATECDAAGPNSVGGIDCTGLAAGAAASSSNPTTMINGLTLGTGITVATTNLFDTAYTGTTNNGIYKGTTGFLDLNAQDFQISSLASAAQFEGLYLVDIRVQENSGLVGGSQTALTAVTVDTVAPEPSTVLLFGGGLVIIGLVRNRRRKLN